MKEEEKMLFEHSVVNGRITLSSDGANHDDISYMEVLDKEDGRLEEIVIDADVDPATIPERYANFAQLLGRSLVNVITDMVKLKTLAECLSYTPSSSVLYDHITCGTITLIAHNNKIYGMYIDADGDETLAIFDDISYYDCSEEHVEDRFIQPDHHKDVYRMMQSLIGLPIDIVEKYLKKIAPGYDDIGGCIDTLISLHLKLHRKGLKTKPSILIPKGEGPYVAVKNDAIVYDKNAAINGCIALVHENQWNVIEKYYESVVDIKDYYGAPYEYDQIQVIRDLDPTVIKFIQLIEDRQFVNRVFRAFEDIAIFE